MNRFKQSKQGGFTLVELIVVIVIIGILAGVYTTYIKGSTDGAKSTAMLRIAEGANDTLSVLAQTCGVSAAVSGNVLPDTAASKTLSDVIFGGVSNVAAAYQACYKQSNVKALTEGSQVVSAGVYSVQGFTVSFAGGGTAPLQVIFDGVPDTITLLTAQKFKPALAALDPSDTLSTTFRYSTLASNARTDTIIKQ